MFLNPFGYDIAFAYTMSLCGGSFLKADLIFYLIAILFFTIFFISSKINPIQLAKIWIDEKIKKIFGFIKI